MVVCEGFGTVKPLFLLLLVLLIVLVVVLVGPLQNPGVAHFDFDALHLLKTVARFFLPPP